MVPGLLGETAVKLSSAQRASALGVATELLVACVLPSMVFVVAADGGVSGLRRLFSLFAECERYSC